MILAGKRDGRRPSAMIFSGNVVVAGNKLSNVTSFTFKRSGAGLTSSNEDNSANFSGEKKYNEAFRVSIFGQSAKKLEIKSRTRSRSRPLS